MTPTKKSNRPIFDTAKGIATLDARNTAARFVMFATLEKAGATRETLSAKGAHFADFKSGVLAGWQGVAFAKKFDKTNEGKVFLSGKVIDRFGGSEVISKTKNQWSTDLSAKLGKLRAAYCEWLADGVVPDAPAGADEPEETAKPAAKRKSGAKKALPVRIKDDVAAMRAAVTRDSESDKPQLTPKVQKELQAAFTRIVDLLK